jgi:hypothetical protein
MCGRMATPHGGVKAGRSAARLEEEGMRHCNMLAPADWPWLIDGNGRGDMGVCLRLLIRPSRNA